MCWEPLYAVIYYYPYAPSSSCRVCPCHNWPYVIVKEYGYVYWHTDYSIDIIFEFDAFWFI